MLRKKLNIDPQSLVPELPNPQDLQPFPQNVAIEFRGHSTRVRALSVSACGRFLATGDDAGNLFVWDTRTARIKRRYFVAGVVDCVAWNPKLCVLLCAAESVLYVIAPRLFAKAETTTFLDALAEPLTTACGNEEGAALC